MNPLPNASGPTLFDGPAGAIEVVVDVPKTAPQQQQRQQGIAIVAHPQPLLGGNALHKVP